jgi:hypothetical protein
MEIRLSTISSQPAADVSWPENPYKGLSFYTSVDVALFGARDEDVRDCTRIVGQEQLKVLLLHGTTGCGKSSFLRAGLIPYLESGIRRFQFLRTYDITDVKALFIRCTEAPLLRLCETLYDWGNTPMMIDLPDEEPEELSMVSIRGEATSRNDFINLNAKSVPNLIKVLERVERLLPKTGVIVIDQGEEVLTLNKEKDNENRKLFFDFLVAFSETSIDLKLIVAFRKEYFGDFFPELESRRYSRENVKAFQLQELSNDQLIEVIKIPTSRSIPPKYLQGRPQPGDHYGFEFDPGVPERIVEHLREVKTQGGILPVLQITCERLHQRAKQRHSGSLISYGTQLITPSKRWSVTMEDYSDLGPLEQQVDLYIDETIQAEINKQHPELTEVRREEELALWKDMLYWMIRRESDNRALTRICRDDELAAKARELKVLCDFDAMSKCLAHEDRRILRDDLREVVGDQTETTAPDSAPTSVEPRKGNRKKKKPRLYYSLGHDAIAVALDKWGATRNVILGRRNFTKRLIFLMTRRFGVYLTFSAAAVITALFFGEIINWQAVLGLLVLSGFGIALAMFAELIANRVIGRLIGDRFFGRIFSDPTVK